jgi:hypothetical protein
MVLISVNPFALNCLLSPSLSSFNHGLYTLALIKCNTFCTNTYDITANSIIKIRIGFITFMSLVAYVIH